MNKSKKSESFNKELVDMDLVFPSSVICYECAEDILEEKFDTIESGESNIYDMKP